MAKQKVIYGTGSLERVSAELAEKHLDIFFSRERNNSFNSSLFKICVALELNVSKLTYIWIPLKLRNYVLKVYHISIQPCTV